MADEKKTYTISEELADELRQEVVRLMFHWKTLGKYAVCEFCQRNVDEYYGTINHPPFCLGQRLIEALRQPVYSSPPIKTNAELCAEAAALPRCGCGCGMRAGLTREHIEAEKLAKESKD
jgi:hypothetical protein